MDLSVTDEQVDSSREIARQDAETGQRNRNETGQSMPTLESDLSQSGDMVETGARETGKEGEGQKRGEPALDWARECFTNTNKDLKKLQLVHKGSRRELQKYLKVALTSFRRGALNAAHKLLHIVDRILREELGIDYVHYQSGHENTLFGFRERLDVAFATTTSAGTRACATKEDTDEYFSFNSKSKYFICRGD